MSNSTIFFLGATGYLGSEVLILLSRHLPQFHVIALVRSPTPERINRLNKIHSNLSVVEGSLDDVVVIQEQAYKADIVINSASSEHLPSVQSTLAGLKERSAERRQPPLYIHISGAGIVSDNSHGEPVEKIQEWSDIGLDLKKCPSTNQHLNCDISIVEAGISKENLIRTIILFPGQIYGVGEGVQKTTLWLRIFLDLVKSTGYAGTWGPGANVMNNIHVKDMASAVLTILRAALEGKADEGAEGLYFTASMEHRISYYEWTKKMGDHLFSKGLIKEGGTRPMPPEIIDPLGEYGWSLLGGNQFVRPDRIARLGWEPVETKKLSLLDSLPAAIDTALAERNGL